MRTASSQASSSTEMLAPLAQSASNVPTPVSMRTLLEAATRGHDQQDARDRGQRVTDGLGDPCAVHPRSTTEGEHRDQQRDERVPDDVEDLLDPVFLVVDDDVGDRLGHHQHDRKQPRRQGGSERPAVLDSPLHAGVVGVRCRYVDPAPSQSPEHGSETMTVGMATSRPSISVVPRSALRVSMAISGPGCGGTRPCIADRPASVGMPMVMTRQLRATGDQVDHRHQHHEAGLEEHRQAGQSTDTGHRRGQGAFGRPADDGVDDLVRPTGVGQQLGEHRTEGDQRADAGGRVTEAGREALDDVVDVLAGEDAHRQSAEDQRQERVHLGPGDQYDDQSDASSAAATSCPPGATGSTTGCAAVGTSDVIMRAPPEGCWRTR